MKLKNTLLKFRDFESWSEEYDEFKKLFTSVKSSKDLESVWHEITDYNLGIEHVYYFDDEFEVAVWDEFHIRQIVIRYYIDMLSFDL